MDHPALTESTYYILLSLYHPQHGYGIMQETQQLSGGRVRLAAGTDRKSTRLNSSHRSQSRMPSSA